MLSFSLFYDVVMPVVYIMCVLSFILFAYDKHCASYSKWRIPEWILILTAVLFGAFGSLCAMVLFNHKTNKKLFYITVPVALFIQILFLAAILSWL